MLPSTIGLTKAGRVVLVAAGKYRAPSRPRPQRQRLEPAQIRDRVSARSCPLRSDSLRSLLSTGEAVMLTVSGLVSAFANGATDIEEQQRDERSSYSRAGAGAGSACGGDVVHPAWARSHQDRGRRTTKENACSYRVKKSFRHLHQCRADRDFMSDVAAAALAYAQYGWRGLPLHGIVNGTCTRGRDCASPGKHPLVRRGAGEATTDPDVIKEWWARWRRANIGIGTWERCGFIIIDIDLPT